MSSIPLPQTSLVELPAELLLQFFSQLLLFQLVNISLTCQGLKQVVEDAPVWEEICLKGGLGKPARKYKTWFSIVLSFSWRIVKPPWESAKGSDIPVSIFNEDRGINMSLCRKCRCQYFTEHPEPEPEEETSTTENRRAHRKQITKMTASTYYKLSESNLHTIGVEYVEIYMTAMQRPCISMKKLMCAGSREKYMEEMQV